jgi:galactokinase
MISAAGQANHALVIDCRSLDTEPGPPPPETVVVVLDTAIRRGLRDSAYHERRRQCEAAARLFGVPALRDVSLVELEARADRLDEVIRRRARHVTAENARTLQAADATRVGDAVRLGNLMNASHASLREDFDVSNRELDAMVACACQDEGCCGARVTGAGFGGCAVALVREDAAAAFCQGAPPATRKPRVSSPTSTFAQRRAVPPWSHLHDRTRTQIGASHHGQTLASSLADVVVSSCLLKDSLHLLRRFGENGS